jgi:hypothetical protein
VPSHVGIVGTDAPAAKEAESAIDLRRCPILERERSVACDFIEVGHAICVQLDVHPSQCGGRQILTWIAVDILAS